MDVLQSIRGTVEQNLSSISKCFQEVLAGLESKEKQLKAVQESVTESSKELDLRRESIEEWVKQVMKKEEELKEIQLVHEKGLRDLELRMKGMGLILKGIKVREEKLERQEKLITELFEKIELERGKIESIQNSMDGKFGEISLKERHVEEKSEKCKLEIELREKILASRVEMLVAKEKELEARERVLDLKIGEFVVGLPKADAAQPGELRTKSRKRGRTDIDKEFIDQVNEVSSSPEASCARTNVTSDSSESNSSSGNSSSCDSSAGNSSSSTTVHEYPDTEFNDFEKHIKENCFAVNQFWAIYDKVDAMPRIYAQIREVDNQESRLCIAWLEVDSTYKGKISNHGFPVGCGKFRRAKSVEVADRLIFSHQIHCEQNGWVAGSFMIYPRKWEIWALFKDWNIGNNSNSDCGKQYNYEIVEVISDFIIENRGIRVVYLDKIRGYVSLFRRAVQNATFRIPASEMFRFSHRIPSYRMNGTEGKGVPKGSFELDTAALPVVLCDASCPDKDEFSSKRK